MLSGVQLRPLYEEAKHNLKRIDNSEINAKDAIYETFVMDTVEKFKRCLQLVEELQLFSRNEDIEDIQTSSLKYILVPFLLAETYQKVMNPDNRLSSLRISKELLLGFLKNCTELGLVSSKEAKMYIRKEKVSEDQTRQEKIERLKQKKDLQQKLEFIEKQKNSEDDAYNDNDEEYEREFYRLNIEISIKQTLDELSILDREIKILEIAKEVRDADGKKEVIEKLLPTERSNCDTKKMSGIPMGTFVIDKGLKIRKDVFKPHWNLPTMTIEEFGELEYKNMLRMKKRECEMKQKGSNKSKEAVLKELREWDDWKDDHPTGSGNTGNKGYVY